MLCYLLKFVLFVTCILTTISPKCKLHVFEQSLFSKPEAIRIVTHGHSVVWVISWRPVVIRRKSEDFEEKDS